MKHTALIPLAASLATAFLIPTDAMNQQILALEDEARRVQDVSDTEWDELPNRESLMSSIEDFIDTSSDKLWSTIDAAVEAVSDMGSFGLDEASSFFDIRTDPEETPLETSGNKGGHHHHGHEHSDKTLYDMIKESKHSQRFADLIDEYDDIKARLQSDDETYTVFVPTDRAFEHMHKLHRHHDWDRDEKPSREFIEEALEYHIVPGTHPVRRLLASHTLPTELRLKDLGNHRQRVRVSAGIFGVRLNFYAKIVATGIFGKNGVVHALDAVLVPPPRQGKLVELFPAKFSTFSLALERTRLGKELHGLPQNGGTAFVPSNFAFTKLGPRLNAFLFSEKGLKYLAALLKYHIVVNETLYSDAFYPTEKHKGRDDSGYDGKAFAFDDGEADIEKKQKYYDHDSLPRDRWHIDLATLLDERSISVDVRRFMGLIGMIVNGWVRVSIQDGVR